MLMTDSQINQVARAYVNDENFYGYGTPFKSVLKVDEARDIVFSHFGTDNAVNPNLTISIVNGL